MGRLHGRGAGLIRASAAKRSSHPLAEPSRRLLVVQSTPYCNLDCSYCYLADRANSERMELDVFERSLRWFYEEGLGKIPFTLLWHAGEPLAVPVDFYDAASESIERLSSLGSRPRIAVQTNGTLVSAEFCRLFGRDNWKVGVSIDGPQQWHDARRINRAGAGTYAKTMAGIERLREHGVAFSVISVVTESTMADPDALYDWYVAHGIRSVAFNPEETDGIHRAAHAHPEALRNAYKAFLRRFMDRVVGDGGLVQVREFNHGLRNLRRWNARSPLNQQSTPWAITSIDHRGGISTFSPELLGTTHPSGGHFVFGDVTRSSIAEIEADERYEATWLGIRKGIERCRSCAYFSVCGGGAPSNKLFENGTFDSADTVHCTLTRKAVIDVLLERIERSPEEIALLSARPS